VTQTFFGVIEAQKKNLSPDPPWRAPGPLIVNPPGCRGATVLICCALVVPIKQKNAIGTQPLPFNVRISLPPDA
jgi:hypothetical protein